MCTRIVQKVLSFPPEGLKKKQENFSLFFFDINTLVSTMLKYCNPFIEEGDILVLRKLLHSTYDLTKMAATKVEFELRKQEEVR